MNPDLASSTKGKLKNNGNRQVQSVATFYEKAVNPHLKRNMLPVIGVFSEKKQGYWRNFRQCYVCGGKTATI